MDMITEIDAINAYYRYMKITEHSNKLMAELRAEFYMENYQVIKDSREEKMTFLYPPRPEKAIILSLINSMRERE